MNSKAITKYTTVLICAVSASSCSNSSSEPEFKYTRDLTQKGFYTPEYNDVTAAYAVDADMTGTTEKVVAVQDTVIALKGLVAQISTDFGGYIRIDEGLTVSLTSISPNGCPATLTGCTTSDSGELHIASEAMLTHVNSIRETIKNQGERGTCLAFAMNAATEMLNSRSQIDIDLSEQNTYFLAKKLAGTWDSAGLDMYTTTRDMVGNATTLVAENYWPYNSDQKYCDNYWQTYPNAYCSQTEAQGGGTRSDQQDPAAASASGYKLVTAHQLYASLGRIKQALYQGHPVILGVNANYDFMLAKYTAGVVDWNLKYDECGTDVCGHAILAIGYVDDDEVSGGGYVVVKNSWGDSWGDHGIAYLTYSWLEHSLLDAQAWVEVAR